MRLHGIHIGALAMIGVAGYCAMSWGIPAFFRIVVFLGTF